MTDGPFRVEPTSDPEWWRVVAPDGKEYTKSKYAAHADVANLNAAWQVAGGPRLLAERDEARSQRDSLLARIHRDGGHYVTQHGLEKAIEDAHEVSATRTVQLDEARALLKELEWCIPNAFDVPTSCPVCWGSKNTGGHAPDCRLAAAIKETTHAK